MQNIVQIFYHANTLKLLGFMDNFRAQFYDNFIYKDRWKYIVDGLKTTLEVTFFALIVGILIGASIAIIRSTYDKNYDEIRSGVGKFFLKLLNMISKLYLTIIRGTPVVVQIMIMYYISYKISCKLYLKGVDTYET